MANFPSTEVEIAALGSAMLNGLANNPEVYPDPPLPQIQLGPLINAYAVSRTGLTEAKAAAEEATDVKNDALEDLIEGLKKNLRYCERVAGNDNDKLMLVGWGARRNPESVTSPAQPGGLIASQQGQGTVTLVWKKAESDSGGPVRSYLIQRRDQGATEFGPWKQVGVSLSTEYNLTGQPRGVDLEYRIIGINKGGESLPSNSIALVL